MNEHLVDFSDDFDKISEIINRQLLKGHEDLLKEVLKMILKREVTNEDGRLITIKRYPGDILDYTLCFGSTDIGRVNFHLEGHKQSIVFNPFPEFGDLMKQGTK